MVSLLLLLLLFHISLSLSFTHSKMLGCPCLCVDDIYNYIDIYINAPRKCNTNTHTEMLYFKEDRACVNSTKRETYIYGLYLASSSHADAKILYPPPIYVVFCTCHASFLRVKVLFSPHVSNQITLCHYLFLTFTFTVLSYYYYFLRCWISMWTMSFT